MSKAKKPTRRTRPGKRPRKPRAGRPRKVFADAMTSAEMADHRRRNGIVLLPIGCFEMHGMQCNMSCDSFIAEATCRILADEWDAVIMPTIHYTDPGATAPWPGSVGVLPLEGLHYVTAVVRAILANGFRRVVIVSLHGPNAGMISMAIQTIFRATGELPILYQEKYAEFCRRVEEEFGRPHGEAACLLASMYICGRHGEFDPSATEDETLEGPKYPFRSRSAWNLRTHGTTFPYHFVEPNNHVGRYPGMTLDDAPRMAEIWREVVLQTARGLPEDYAKFQKDMWQAMRDKPWADL